MAFSGMFSGDERKRKEQEMRSEGRLPPGQSLTLKWPVLHYGSVPRFDVARWDFRISGLVEHPLRFTWNEFNQLPRVQRTSDFHCVTRWSRFNNRWDGVAMREMLARAKPLPEAKYALVHAEQGYTANLPLSDIDRENVLLATHHDGEPLTADHGYPLRLIVPHLYAWKSVKWIRGLELLSADQAGFWEQNGYHMRGDPFKEQRLNLSSGALFLREGPSATSQFYSHSPGFYTTSPRKSECVEFRDLMISRHFEIRGTRKRSAAAERRRRDIR